MVWRSEILKRILSETPDQVREEVKQIANKMVEENKSPETKPDSTIENAKHHLIDDDKDINVYKADVSKLLFKIESLQSELTKLREENENLRKWKEKWESQEFMRGRYSHEEVDKLVQDHGNLTNLLLQETGKCMKYQHQLSKANELLKKAHDLASMGVYFWIKKEIGQFLNETV